ncbi:MAG: hypothetical protein IH594_18430 [Bacteroidales bacterium]|nr:hypothetical protein [Bacteroidales bacterium]
MQTIITRILKILKDHVNQNNQEIQYNQDDINRLVTGIAQNISKKDIEYKTALNKELMGENEDFIQMQLQLTEFMEKYAHLFHDSEFEEDLPEEEEDILPYFSKTVSGHLKFGPAHPQFNNKIFFQELMKYYQERENYEMCQQLLRIKKNSLKEM